MKNEFLAVPLAPPDRSAWIRIARCARVGGEWEEIEGAPYSVKAAHAAHAAGHLFLACKYEPHLIFFMIQPRITPPRWKALK